MTHCNATRLRLFPSDIFGLVRRENYTSRTPPISQLYSVRLKTTEYRNRTSTGFCQSVYNRKF